MQPPLANRCPPGVSPHDLEQAEQPRHVGPHAQSVHPSQAKGQKGDPQPAQCKQHGNRLWIVEITYPVLTLAKAQAYGKADAQFPSLTAIALQPRQQQSVECE